MESHAVEEPASLADEVDCRCLVDVWIGSLNHPHPNVPACEVLLSAEERARAARYRFDHSRTAFLRSRAYLCGILASRLRTPPQDIPLWSSPAGGCAPNLWVRI